MKGARASSRRRRSPTAWSTRAPATAISSRSISRPASCAGSTPPATCSANRPPPSAAGSSISATCRASCTPSTPADGSKAWTFKTGSEIKSSPVIAGERVLIGSYDTHLYALDAAHRQGRLEAEDRRAGARDADGRERHDLLRRLRRAVPRRAADRRRGAVPGAARREHRLVGGDRGQPGVSRDVQQRGRRDRSGGEEDRVALQGSGSRVPVLLVAGAGRRPGVSSAAATRRSTRSTRRPARRRGSW